jgi:hypothetical protein
LRAASVPVEREEERMEGRAREGPPRKGIHRASGPTVNIGGTAPACPVASDLVGGQVFNAAT